MDAIKLTRKQALNAYQRVQDWEQRQSNELREAILVKHFGGSLCCLHNWMLNYEAGRVHITAEAYHAGKYYNWKQRQIWDTSTRLEQAFARYF